MFPIVRIFKAGKCLHLEGWGVKGGDHFTSETPEKLSVVLLSH